MFVTAENIREVMDVIPSDQAEDLRPGCETWPLALHDGLIEGHITVWPEIKIAAVSWGRGSFWGRWHGDERIILLDQLSNDHSLLVDEAGEMWVYMTPSEFDAWMGERFVRSWDPEGLERVASGEAPEALTISVGCSRLRIFRGEELAGRLLSAMRDPEGGSASLKPNIQ